LNIRQLAVENLVSITEIYNQGIEDRVATLEQSPKTVDEVTNWLINREARYKVIVAERDDQILGWASINPYSHR
jgi:phosphinothricin acetyltransferase